MKTYGNKIFGVYFLFLCSLDLAAEQKIEKYNDVDSAVRVFRNSKKKVVSFVGYAGADYEHPTRMLKEARRILESLDPTKTLINIGATEVGIGAIYKLAKQLGFETSGVITSLSEGKVEYSPYCDRVVVVTDKTWGGYNDQQQISPTSHTKILISQTVVGIGGGQLAEAELIEAIKLGKNVEFIPADMNHEIAREFDLSKGLPEPTTFHGRSHDAMLQWLPSGCPNLSVRIGKVVP